MSNQIDQKVVEMRFDNAQFEAGVAQSMSTIDRLKRSLDFQHVGAGLKTALTKSSTSGLSNIEKSLGVLTKRFSIFGIASARVIQRLTDSAMNLGRKITHAISDPLIHGGIERAMNIAQAKFMVEGLEQAWDDVKESVNEAVTDTAYGFDEAAKAAAQLGASGIKAGDDLTKHLLAIGGTAAMTGANFAEISDVFTSVAGQGKLMAYQLNQLSFRGLNAAAVLAQQLGKTETEIRDMVHRGEIDFDTFSKAMYDAFGTHAKDANKTFTGALANMKAALKRIGQEVALPALDSFRDVFNALKGAINKVHTALGTSESGFLGDMVKGIDYVSKALVKFIDMLDFSWVEGAADTVKNVFLGLVGIVLRTRDALKGTFGGDIGKSILDIGKSIHSWSEGFRQSHFTQYLEDVKVKAEAAKKPLYDVTKLAKEVIGGDYGNGQKRVKELHNLGYSYAKVQNKVNKLLGSEVRHKETAEDLAAEEKLRKKLQDKATKSIDRQTKSIQKSLTVYDKLANIIAGAVSAVKILASMTSAFYKILLKPAIITFLRGALSVGSAIGAKIVELQKYTSKNDTFTKAFTKLKSVLVLVYNNILKVVKGVSNFTSRIRNFATAVRNFKPLQIIVKGIATAFTSIANAIKDTPGKLKTMGSFLKDSVPGLQGYQHLVEVLTGLKDVIAQGLLAAFQKLTGVAKTAGDSAASLFTKENILTAIDFLSDKIADLIELLMKTGDAAKGFYDKFAGKIGNPFEAIGKTIGGLSDSLKSIKTSSNVASDSLSTILSEFGKAPKIVYDNSKKVGTNLFLGLSEGFKSIDVGKVLSWAKTATSIYAMFKFVDFLKELGKGIDSVKKIPKKIGGVFDALSSAIAEHEKKIKADTVWTLAKSIFVICSALLLLSGIDTDKLASIAIDVAAVIAAVSLLVWVIGKLPEKSKANQADETLKELGESLSSTIRGFGSKLGNAILEAGKSFGKAATIMAFATSITMLVGTFITLAKFLKTGEGDIKGAATIMGVIAVAITAFIGILSYLPSTPATAGTAATILAVASAIKSLSKTMNAIGKMDPEEFNQGAGAIVGLAVALGIFTALAGNIKESGAARDILKLALAMVVLCVPLKLLSKENPTNLIGIALALGVLAVAAVGFGEAAQNITVGAKNMIILAGAMLVLAAALRIVAPISDQVFDSITALIVIMGAMALGGVIAQNFGEGFMVFAGSLLAVAGAFVLFGAGALLFGKGVEAIGNGLSLIGQGFIDLASGFITSLELVTANRDAITQGIIDTVKSIADGLEASKSDAMRGAAAFVTGIALGIALAVPAIEEAGRAIVYAILRVLVGSAGLIADAVLIAAVLIINEVARVIAENSGPIINAVINLVRAIAIFVFSFIGQVAESIVGKNPLSDWCKKGVEDLKSQMNYESGYEIGKMFAKGQSDGYKDGSEPIVPEANKSVEEVVNTVTEKANEVADGGIPGLNGMFQKPMQEELDATNNVVGVGADKITSTLMNAIQNGANPEELANIAGVSGDSLVEGLGTSLENGDVSGAMSTLTGKTIDQMYSDFEINSPSKVSERAGEGLVEGLALGLSKNHNAVSSVMASLVSKVSNAFKGKSFGSAGATLMKGLVSALKSGSSQAKTTLAAGVTQWRAAITSKAGQFLTAGSTIMRNFVNGLKEKANDVKNAFTRALSNARSAASGYGRRFYSIGSSLMEGLRSGIMDKVHSIASAASSVVSRAIQAAKDKAKINSPSKEFMWIGEGFGEGLIKGINNFSNSVAKSSANMVGQAIETAQDSLTMISDLISTEANPVITPIIDTDNIYATAADIDRLFNTQSMGLNSQVSAVMNGMQSAQNESKNLDIINQLKKLGRDISNLPRNNYTVNGVTYDDGSNIHSAIETLIRATVVEGRA